ncbi:Polyphosphoinositide phosphatase; AltName: Full=Phosphatidylinositol 3,5-bisphosphate 5-phosphatase; AltName: Full=SAC domain-containing protein 3 [Serendipita indica DSM 11827]|nr:Polyphosphoinositide phosphatase; AltName: Full=Phosphatidylinositol 3,5-bisphosphate 5-phosphatase; AltName: Full=SAC domain-containing protein 3 [Serendipita indica DSM 11827]
MAMADERRQALAAGPSFSSSISRFSKDAPSTFSTSSNPPIAAQHPPDPNASTPSLKQPNTTQDSKPSFSSGSLRRLQQGFLSNSMPLVSPSVGITATEGVYGTFAAMTGSSESQNTTSNKANNPSPSLRPMASSSTLPSTTTGYTEKHTYETFASKQRPPPPPPSHAGAMRVKSSVLNKFLLYETKTRFYIVASNANDSRHKMLKIDRTHDDELVVHQDDTTYTGKQMNSMLKMLEDGNRGSGGLGKPRTFFGIAGTSPLTPVDISEHEQDSTPPISPIHKVDNPTEEQRLLTIFKQVDMTKNFYFSYSYDITSTLQRNLTGCAKAEARGKWSFNERFAWNHHMLDPAFGQGVSADGKSVVKSDWAIPLMHGHVDQAKLTVLGRVVYVTLIARRSRYYAGARYLKRGVNEDGDVANEVETEQIVFEASTTGFYAPAPRFAGFDLHEDDGGDSELGSTNSAADEVKKTGAKKRNRTINPRYTSFVQYRGSIPIYWAQEAAGVNPRPPIEITIADPYYVAAGKHFDNLFERYGTPVIILNLIKWREPREKLLLYEYSQCVDFLNQFLPEDKKMVWRAYDMAQMYREKDKDVISYLEDLAEEAISKTGFFHSGPEPYAHKMKGDDEMAYRDHILLQNGVCRTNCVDCLDRTNAAQFVFGKRALGHQLYALGIVDSPNLVFDSDAVNMLTEMYHDHGDTIALQYTGSALVNRVEMYRRMPHWNSHSRDIIENLKRFYHNQMLDADRQLAINTFLGITDDRGITGKKPTKFGGYDKWFDPEKIGLVKKSRKLKDGDLKHNGSEQVDWREVLDCHHGECRFDLDVCKEALERFADGDGASSPAALDKDPHDATTTEFWVEYYKPLMFTGLVKHFSYGMNSTLKLPGKTANDVHKSPFVPREAHLPTQPRIMADFRRWMMAGNQSTANNRRSKYAGWSEGTSKLSKDSGMFVSEKPITDPTSIEAVVERLLDPLVTEEEFADYQRYVNQYQALLAAPSGLEGIDKADLEFYEAVVASCAGEDLDEPYFASYPPAGTSEMEQDDVMEGTVVSGPTTDVERYQQRVRERQEKEELFALYVDKPKKLERGAAGGRGPSSLAEPYERWLKGFDADLRFG